MHYCCLVITKEFPTDEVLEEVLRPFNSEDYYDKPEAERGRLAFTWDWYRVGGRYGGQLKLKIDPDDEKYRWRYIVQEPRSGRLFRSELLEALEKYHKSGFWYYEGDYFCHMGGNDGFLYVDAALADDIQNVSEIGCYCFVDQNGNAFARDYYNGELETNTEFDDQLSNAKEKCTGCYICVVDLHD